MRPSDRWPLERVLFALAGTRSEIYIDPSEEVTA